MPSSKQTDQAAQCSILNALVNMEKVFTVSEGE